jgi:4-diphosphocytidyl-2-C-methyl-D-erythritol kinase
MIVFPNCKINLGLRMLRKRSDGFHDLETIFYPLPVKDVLEIIVAKNTQHSTPDSYRDNVQFSNTGSLIKAKAENNLCIKAYQLIKNDFPELPAVDMHLHKAIPIGAGLGGGSSDGAFTLRLLNKKFDLGLSTERLADYALQLGSDCPFFIINKPCAATGRGEIFEPITLDFFAYKIIVVNPGIHVSTSWAFSQLDLSDRLERPDSIKKIIQQSIETWKENLKNDFEEPVFNKYPELKQIKDQLYNDGAVYAAMSGSGSTVYGIFKKEDAVKISFPSNYFVRELKSQAK